MIRTAARALGATVVVALLVVGAAACSGSEGGSDDGSTGTTVEVSTATTDPRLGDLSDLDGGNDGLSGGDLDCYNVSLAFVALALAPANALEGGGQDAVERIQADIDTLRSQIPEAIAGDFDAYAEGVQRYATALAGIDVSSITDADTQRQLVEAGSILEEPEVTAAQDAIETYFSRTCPGQGTATTTA